MILDADTAAVLLREEGLGPIWSPAPPGDSRARCGKASPSRSASGFAGRDRRHAASRCSSTGSTPRTVANPILWEKGVRVMLGVPLLSNDEVIGVLHVGRLDDRGFTGDDAELLQVAADRVAAAVQAQRLAVESAAARLLERSLQPTRLPTVPGLRLAGRYVPAESRTIGGDWYDAFTAAVG